MADWRLTQIPIHAICILLHLCLQVLILTNNKLTQIHKEMWNGLRSLRILILRENKIHTLGKTAFLPLKKLNILSLESNKLTWINSSSESWAGLSSLDELIANDNKIRHIDKESWYPLKNLSKLFLPTNKLEELDLSPLTMLHELNIGFNRKLHLGSNVFLPESISEFTFSGIKEGNLTSNTFQYLVYLTELTLYNDKIQYIESNTFL